MRIITKKNKTIVLPKLLLRDTSSPKNKIKVKIHCISSISLLDFQVNNYTAATAAPKVIGVSIATISK